MCPNTCVSVHRCVCVYLCLFFGFFFCLSDCLFASFAIVQFVWFGFVSFYFILLLFNYLFSNQV